MDRRYKLFSAEGVRNIAAYNDKATQKLARRLPYVVIVIDELADLMMVAAGEIEELICRIAQLARAVGIHLIIATQRPSTDIITGLIKANIPSRIAFAVGSQVDSRVILDTGGAEKLLGRGDMLYQPVDAGKPTRIQGAFVSEPEVEGVVNFWKSQGGPRYMEEILEEGAVSEGDGQKRAERKLDPLFARSARAVAAAGAASVSLGQRTLNVGESRTGRAVAQPAEHLGDLSRTRRRRPQPRDARGVGHAKPRPWPGETRAEASRGSHDTCGRRGWSGAARRHVRGLRVASGRCGPTRNGGDLVATSRDCSGGDRRRAACDPGASDRRWSAGDRRGLDQRGGRGQPAIRGFGSHPAGRFGRLLHRA